MIETQMGSRLIRTLTEIRKHSGVVLNPYQPENGAQAVSRGLDEIWKLGYTY